MMGGLNVLKFAIASMCVVQAAGSSSLRGDAPSRELYASGSAPSGTGSGTGGEPVSSGASQGVPAHDATDEADNSHQAQEATKSDNEKTHSPWRFDEPNAIYTALGVIWLIIGLALTIAVYLRCRKEEKMQEEAAAQAPADAKSGEKIEIVMPGDKGDADDSVSTQAGSQSPSRRTSLGSDVPVIAEEAKGQ